MRAFAALYTALDETNVAIRKDLERARRIQSALADG